MKQSINHILNKGLNPRELAREPGTVNLLIDRKPSRGFFISVGVLTHGFDYPELDTVVLARPTMSLSLYYQMIGRAIRPHSDKTSAWVVDMCDNLSKFGKVEDLKVVDTGNGKWIITNNGKQLTNVYFGEGQWHGNN